MTERTLHIARDSWPIEGGFTIARGTKTAAETVTVILKEGGHTGRGECVPYARYNETVTGVIGQIESIRPALESGLTREELQTALPPGAARNAADCALWDLEAKKSGKDIFALLGHSRPDRPLITAFTIGLGTPEEMGRKARAARNRPVLKVKLGGKDDLACLQAVRDGAPDARLIVDANEGWDTATYEQMIPAMEAIGIALIEQPFPAGDDDALQSLPRPVPICADEAAHTRHGLEELRRRYDFINIKLDKTGGLTEALALEKAARNMGFGIMVGCMLATSLAMAPAWIVAQGAEFVDLDGPLLLSRDRSPGLRFDGSAIHPPEPALWG